MQNGHADIRSYLESIDKRVEGMHDKLDNALANTVTQTACDQCRSERVDKRFFLGVSSGVAGLVLFKEQLMRLFGGGG